MAVIFCSDPVHNAKSAIQKRLQTHGARTVTRISKEITHIVFERRRSQRASDKKDEEVAILSLYRKLDGVREDLILMRIFIAYNILAQFHRYRHFEYYCAILLLQMPFPPVVVSPLWVEDSITQGRRLIENRYMVARPKEHLLAATPASASNGATTKKRKNRSGPAVPKPAENFDLDPQDWFFSSTQQLNTDAEELQAAPLSGSKRHSRLRNLRASALHAPLHAPHQEDKGAAENSSAPPALRVGTATQAVADILAIDLPGENEDAWNEEDQNDLDTPLSERYARQSSRKRLRMGKEGSEEKNSGGRKSRLGQASYPDAAGAQEGLDIDVAEAEYATQMDEEEPRSFENEDDDLDIDGLEDPNGPPRNDISSELQQAATAAVGVASRFSLRNLRPDRPLQLHKGTPLVPILPAVTKRAHGRSGVIPIPDAKRVASPWNEPTPKTAARPGGLRKSSLGQGFKEGNFGVKLAPLKVNFGGFSVPRPVDSGSGTPTLPTTLKKAITRDKVPSPWSPRAWDNPSNDSNDKVVDKEKARAGSKGRANGGAQRSRFAVENGEDVGNPMRSRKEISGPASGGEEFLEESEIEIEEAAEEQQHLDYVPCSDEEEAEEENVRENIDKTENRSRKDAKKNVSAKMSGVETQQIEAKKTKIAPRKPTNKGRKPLQTEEEREGEEIDEEEGPSHGFISVTSVSASIVQLCESAVKRLRGLRLCIEGKEDGVVTHLLIGDERRTMKAMLAVANGAHFVTPEWLTASLEAGRWLPERSYKPSMRFVAAADRARASMDASTEGQQLLAQHAIHVCPGKGKAGPLRRIASALGASTASLKNCSLCVVAGKNGERPAGLPRQVPAVSEEWLLEAAESYKIPNVKSYGVS